MEILSLLESMRLVTTWNRSKGGEMRLMSK